MWIFPYNEASSFFITDQIYPIYADILNDKIFTQVGFLKPKFYLRSHLLRHTKFMKKNFYCARQDESSLFSKHHRPVASLIPYIDQMTRLFT